MSQPGAPGNRRGRAWDESAVREALTAFLAERDDREWPTYDEFVRGGAKGLRDVIMRLHGTEWWAREMGLPGGGRARGGIRRWTDETIAAALATFLGDRRTWPTRREFKAAGLRGLREALPEHGGVEHWAARMGVELPAERRPSARAPSTKRIGRRQIPAAPRRWPLWDEPRIERELRAFLTGRDEWPRHREFVAAGHKQLYHAVLTHGGTRLWAARTGVQWVQRLGGRSLWSDERVRTELAIFLYGRSAWPIVSEFRRGGQEALLSALRRRGGSERWRAEFGLARRAPRRAGPPPVARGPRHRVRQAQATPSHPRWDEARIAAAITPLVSELGRWPTKSEFRRAGLGSALAAVYDHGGSAVWQKRMGVARRESSSPVPDRTRWTDEEIEVHLRGLCRGRDRWPSRSEFERAGARPLYHALRRHGGVDHWRRRLGYG